MSTGDRVSSSALSSTNPYPFKPMGIGEMIEKTFQIYMKTFKTLFLIVLIPQILGGLAGYFLKNYRLLCDTDSVGTCTGNPLLLVLLFVFVLIGALILYVWTSAAGVIAVNGFIHSVRLTALDAFSKSKGLILSLACGAIVYFLVVLGGLILLIVPGILFLLDNYLYLPAITLEKLKGVEGNSRSRFLVMRRIDGYPHPRWYVLVMLLILSGIGLGAAGIIYIPSMVYAILSSKEFSVAALAETMNSPSFQMQQTALRILINSAVMPLGLIFSTILFLDLKLKKGAGIQVKSS